MSKIKICGHCTSYKFNNNPGLNGGCKAKGYKNMSPLAVPCNDYKEE